jgi:DNA-binding MarR family transcriptional regulator
MTASRRKTGDSPSAKVSDPVDWARHFWQRHDLGEKEDAFIAMSSVLRFHRLLIDSIESQLRKHALNVTDYMLLMTLQLSETGTRLISQLARTLLVHATTATLAIDRLENRALIQRTPHPTDRRATQVSLTPKGRRLLAKATDALREIDFGFAGSDVEDQRGLIDLLAELRLAAGDTDTPMQPSRTA